MTKVSSLLAASTLAAVMMMGTAAPALADLVQVDIFNNVAYTQTDGTAPTTPSAYFFNIDGQFSTPGDFDSASVSYPGAGSPANLPITGTGFHGGGAFGTASALQTAFPFGAYTITASNSSTSTSQSAVINYGADHFTNDIPALSSATFDALNGMDPVQALQIVFNAFTPDAAADEAFIFFTITDPATNAIVFDAGFLPSSTTSVELLANTLTADTQYDFELDFSDRLDGVDDATGVFTVQGFDVRTDGSFTTGAASVPAPEPLTLSLFAAGLFGATRRRQKAPSPTKQ